MAATIHEGNKLTINTYGVLAAGQLGSRFGGINCSGCAKGQRSLVVVNGFNEEMSRGGRESQRPPCSPSIGAASSQPLPLCVCARATAGAPAGRPVGQPAARHGDGDTSSQFAVLTVRAQCGLARYASWPPRKLPA
jgi:hypothetical protein